MNSIIAYILAITIYALISMPTSYLFARIYGVVVTAFTLWYGDGYFLFKKQIGGIEYRLGWLPLGGRIHYKVKRDTGRYTRHDCIEFQPVYQQITILSSGNFIAFSLFISSYYLRDLTGLFGVFSCICAVLFVDIFPYYIAKFSAHRIAKKQTFDRLVTVAYYFPLIILALCLYAFTPFFEDLFNLFAGNIKLWDYTNTPISQIFLALAGFLSIETTFLGRLVPINSGLGVFILDRLKAMHSGYRPTKKNNVEEDESLLRIVIEAVFWISLLGYVAYQLLS